ncbi:hypothetical protein EG329_009588 [Mollisiaceae sp. DMI_Dod_QoI]|nr:hypothetical protein EG329_009588 [Helotiales sp. DMI_Dod_QoI]
MSNPKTWHEINLSNEEDLELPEIEKGSSKPSSNTASWPLSSSAPPPPNYPQTYELRPIPPTSTGVSQDISILPPLPPLPPARHSDPAADPEAFNVEFYKPRRSSGWKTYLLVTLVFLSIIAITFSAAFAISIHVDSHETEAQIDSKPENMTSTSTSSESEVSTSVSTQLLTSTSISALPTTLIETTTQQPSTLSQTTVQTAITTQITTIVSNQIRIQNLQESTIFIAQINQTMGAVAPDMETSCEGHSNGIMGNL